MQSKATVGPITAALARQRHIERIRNYRLQRDYARKAELRSIRNAEEHGTDVYDWCEDAAAWRRLGDMWHRCAEVERSMLCAADGCH